jgi:hypothetical protein
MCSNQTFRLRLPATIFNDRNPQNGEFLQLLTIDDGDVGQPLSFDWVMLDAGAVMKPIGAPVPEPRTVALLALGLAAVGWTARRRRGG